MKNIAFQAGLTDLSTGIFVGNVRHVASALHLTFEVADESCMFPVLEWLRNDPIESSNPGPLKGVDLRHELSVYTEPVSTDVFVDGRSLCEINVIDSNRLPTDLSNFKFDYFCEMLAYLNSVVVFKQSSFRTTEVRTASDKRGNYVKYPRPCYIFPRLQCIHSFILAHCDAEPGLAAVVTMAALTNLHPFVDGNGRVARILFNWLMNLKREENIYLPIYEISAFSYGGYLIRLRQAHYHSNWEPLFRLLLACANRLFLDSASGAS